MAECGPYLIKWQGLLLCCLWAGRQGQAGTKCCSECSPTGPAKGIYDGPSITNSRPSSSPVRTIFLFHFFSLPIFFFFNQAARISTLPCLCFHSPQWFFHSVNRKDILPNPSKAASLMEKHSISCCSTTVSTKQIKAEMCRFCTTGVATSVANCFSKTVLQPCFHLSFFGHSGSLIPGELVFFFSVSNENLYNSLISRIY